MRGRPMQGRPLGTVSGGCMTACVSAFALRTIWFGQEEDFLLRAPVTEEGYIRPVNYVKVFEDYGQALILDLESEVEDIVTLTSQDVLGQGDQPVRRGTWRIYRGGPMGLWITWEEAYGICDTAVRLQIAVDRLVWKLNKIMEEE